MIIIIIIIILLTILLLIDTSFILSINKVKHIDLEWCDSGLWFYFFII